MKPNYPTHARVDLARLHENIDLIGATARAPLMPVIKADAYGHGAVHLAREIAPRSDVEALAVGTVEEGVELRRAGIKGRIVVLDGVFPERAAAVSRLGLEVVISSAAEARVLAARCGRDGIRAHVKVNTGMTRLGAHPEEAFEFYKAVSGLKKISVAGLMTHLADAFRKRGQAKRQLAVFDDISGSLRGAGFSLPPRHAANTAGIFLHPSSRYDMVRPGIGIYGVQGFSGKKVGLRPALRWEARVMLVRELRRGETVSYGMTWVSPGRRKVAVVCVGYADGYSRTLSNKARAIIGGKKIRQVGVICMDNCLFDVTGTDVAEGDYVTLLGGNGSNAVEADDLARLTGTIPWETLCGIGRRAPRIYSGGRVYGRGGKEKIVAQV